MGSSPTRGLRRAVYDRDAHRCRYCGIDLTGYPELRTVDHVIPVSRGGMNTLKNLVTSCRRCNRRKRDMLLYEAMMRLIPLQSDPPDYEYGECIGGKPLNVDPNRTKRRKGKQEVDPFIVRDVLDVL